MTPNDQLKTAAQYIGERLKWPVFPLIPRDKRPLTEHGYKAASNDKATIETWWTQYPDANIGVPTGRQSGFFVLDIDERHGGWDSLHSLEQAYGKLPATPIVMTGGGGCHYYFLSPELPIPCRTGILPGVDVRSDGGYVVVPPSIHNSGKKYFWEASSRIGDIPFARAPKYLLDLICGPTAGKKKSLPELRATIMNGISEGSRNDALASIVGHLLFKDVDAQITRSLAIAWNSLNSPPLPADEVLQTIESITGRELARRNRK